MAKSKRMLARPRRQARDQEFFFLAAAQTANTGMRSLRDPADRVEVGRPFREIFREWQTIMGQVSKLVVEANKVPSADTLPLHEVQVSIGFSVTGKVVLVGEATAEAAVTLTFTKG